MGVGDVLLQSPFPSNGMILVSMVFSTPENVGVPMKMFVNLISLCNYIHHPRTQNISSYQKIRKATAEERKEETHDIHARHVHQRVQDLLEETPCFFFGEAFCDALSDRHRNGV